MLSAHLANCAAISLAASPPDAMRNYLTAAAAAAVLTLTSCAAAVMVPAALNRALAHHHCEAEAELAHLTPEHCEHR